MTPQRPQLAVLVALMAFALVLACSLAFQVYAAGRQHRAAAEQDLRDQAQFAAKEWNQAFNVIAGNSFVSMLLPAMQAWSADGGISAEDVRGLLDLRTVGRPEMIEPMVRAAFAYDEAHPGVQVVGDFDQALVETVIEPALDRARLDGPGPRFGIPAGPDWVVTFQPMEWASGERVALVSATGVREHRGALGFVASSAFSEHIFNTAHALAELFATRNSHTDSVFAVSVADVDGEVWFESRPLNSAFLGVDSTEALLAPGMITTVGVLPGAEEQLLSGGWPPNRLPQVLFLLVLTTSVIAATVLLIRREAELVRLRSDFVAGVSHELRTPLAQIQMFTETLLLGRVRSDAERQRSLEIIDQEARRLNHLVQNVLMFARSERGNSRLQPEATDIAADVRDAVHGFAILSRTKAVDVRLELQEGIIVAVDRGALRQVVLNLLDNAVKYGPLGQRITVGLGLFGGDVRLWVDDEGPGVPVAERTRVFESFYRLDRDSTSPVAGSGIGLAIVRELVLLHDGRVWIDEAPGGGARVVAEFPGGYLNPEAAQGSWAVA